MALFIFRLLAVMLVLAAGLLFPAWGAESATPLSAPGKSGLEARAAAVIVPDIALDNVPIAEAIRVLEGTARKASAQLGVPADIQITASAHVRCP